LFFHRGCLGFIFFDNSSDKNDHKGLFLNADAGFDSKEFRKA